METELKDSKSKDDFIELGEKRIQNTQDLAKKKVLSKLQKGMKRTLKLIERFHKLENDYKEYLANGGPKNERLEESLNRLKEMTE